MIDVDTLHRVTTPLGAARALGLRAAPGTPAHAPRVLCPAHDDFRPSCTITVKQARIVWYCHACHEGGDLVTLAAAVWGLDHRRQFRAIVDRLGVLLGASIDARPNDRPRAAAPAADLALAIDAMADDHVAGRRLRPSDVARVEAATPAAISYSLRALGRAEAAQREHEATIDDELDRLADVYELKHSGCECQGGTLSHVKP